MASIFISYSHTDEPLLQLFILRLNEFCGGHTFWFDEHIPAGAQWQEEIFRQIEQNDLFIYLISDEAIESPHCHKELQEAIRLHKPILPVIVRPLKPVHQHKIEADILGTIQYVNLAERGGFQDKRRFHSLCVAINSFNKSLSQSLHDVSKWIKIENGQNHFWLYQHPVTQGQFRTFLDASNGYSNKNWWKDAEPPPRPVLRDKEFDDHPITNVSWYDAAAFCRWFSVQQRMKVRLPRQYEWELAAVSAGNYDNIPGNTAQQNIQTTSPAGYYGSLQNGLQDMKGNVLEWCQNNSIDPYNLDDSGSMSRSLRGGSYKDYEQDCQIGVSHHQPPAIRREHIGFRLMRVNMYEKLEVDLDMKVRIDPNFVIDERHPLWTKLESLGAKLKGNRNEFPVQVQDKVGLIPYNVRRGILEAGDLLIEDHSITVVDAILQGNKNPVWSEVGLDGVPLLWGSAAIVYTRINNIVRVLLGQKQAGTGVIVNTYANQFTPPAGIVELEDFSLFPCLREALINGALRELSYETTLTHTYDGTNISIGTEHESFNVECEIYVFVETERCKPQAFVLLELKQESDVKPGMEKEFEGLGFNSFEDVKDKVLSIEAMQAFRLLNPDTPFG
jgi:hypothetical protein